MSRKYRRRRGRKRSSPWLVATQVIFLIAVLVFVVFSRELIVTGAANLFDAFVSPDIQVSQPDAQHRPAAGPDAGRIRRDTH